ncbi:MAG: CPBP family intramembrane metalloprotease [Candidatus Omnitrophica bacterium]|nr:CPBP family intramembrane metalloprotease [Candidatus Omnitrophota bacterium]
MSVIRETARYFGREKGVTLMTLVLFACLIWAWASSGHHPASSADDPFSEASRIQTTQEIRDLSRSLETDFSRHPGVVSAVLVLILMAALGALVDLWLLARYREKVRGGIRFLGRSPAGWSLGDVFGLFVLLFFSEWVISACFAVLDRFELIPVLGPNTILMASTFLRSLVVLAALLHLAGKKYGRSLADLGFGTRRIWKQCAVGIVAYAGMIPLYLIVVVGVSQVVHWVGVEPPVQTPVQVLYREDNSRLLWSFALFMGIAGPWFEEVFFRGFVYQAFRVRWGVRGGVALTSVLFAALHANWVAFFPILILALALNVLFEETGSVIPGAVLHMTHNLVMLGATLGVKTLLAAG